MSNHSYATVVHGFSKGSRMFMRSANAEITKNLQSAFVPVTVETPLDDGQKYMGGVIFSLCETQWFFDKLIETGRLEKTAEEVLTAVRDWVHGADDGAWASKVIEDVRQIVIKTADRMGWIIDLSMSYSITKSYIDGYQMEMEDPEREVDAAPKKGHRKSGRGKDVFVDEEPEKDPVTYRSIRMPEFLVKEEPYLVMLIDEDSQTAIIWDWPSTYRQPNCPLWVNPKWYGNPVFEAHCDKVLATLKSERSK